ncbi:MAG: histidinol dehydrogenase [Clostridia bacterium]|nr:histidinol dehydrogenase [Clostridia bacterium]
MIEIIDAKDYKNKSVEIGYDREIENAVSQIISEVVKKGDEAVFSFTEKFDGVKLDSLLVSEEEIEEAYSEVDEYFIQTLTQAKENIECYHLKQKKTGYDIEKGNGIKLGQIVRPLSRVAVYVPGGTAAYPSTVLMDVIPAKIAGVREVVIITPPSRDGKVNKNVLAAAKLVGADKVYKIGGAQAVAAMAYGTESIKKVDKIVGPGNAYVATAKKQVFGQVDIDMIAGPSEILIVADDTAKVEFVASDLLGQAEHDKRAGIYLVCLSYDFAEKVKVEVDRQLALLSRRDIAEVSVNNGKIIVAKDLKEAMDIANQVAPEHLELCVKDPFSALKMVENAGGIFLGNYAPEALGDYFAGTNHTLPTSGTARFASPLSVDDFVKKSSYLYYTEDELKKVGERVYDFAEREGLTAHAESIKVRLK